MVDQNANGVEILEADEHNRGRFQQSNHLLFKEYKTMNQTALGQMKLNVDEYYFPMIEECPTSILD